MFSDGHKSYLLDVAREYMRLRSEDQTMHTSNALDTAFGIVKVPDALQETLNLHCIASPSERIEVLKLARGLDQSVVSCHCGATSSADHVSRAGVQGMPHTLTCETAKALALQGLDGLPCMADIEGSDIEDLDSLLVQASDLRMDVDVSYIVSTVDLQGLRDRIADGLCDGQGTIISSRIGVGYLPCAGCNACNEDIDMGQDVEAENLKQGPEPVSMRNVSPWIVKGRGFSSSLAHDIEQERARIWISSHPFDKDSGV